MAARPESSGCSTGWSKTNFSAEVFHAIRAVSGLRRGRSEAYEPEPVKPAPDEWVDATLPHVSSVVASIVELQRLTGMRSGEIVIMRGSALDTTGKSWTYVPATHKTEHHGHGRPIYLGRVCNESYGPS